jgi:hypothetical protein
MVVKYNLESWHFYFKELKTKWEILQLVDLLLVQKTILCLYLLNATNFSESLIFESS